MSQKISCLVEYLFRVFPNLMGILFNLLSGLDNPFCLDHLFIRFLQTFINLLNFDINLIYSCPNLRLSSNCTTSAASNAPVVSLRKVSNFGITSSQSHRKSYLVYSICCSSLSTLPIGIPPIIIILIDMFNYMAMNVQQVREGVQKFGPAVGARKMIDQEYLHAQQSLENGIYITFACPNKKSECTRLGSSSKCFCGHQLGNHKQAFFAKKFNTACEQCPCKQFKFVPARPEECGMYWLVRRKDFNVTKWRPPCKCKHNCEEHDPNYPLRCKLCQCPQFDSYFECISCDSRWEQHEVFYETEQERAMANKPIGKSYLPLSSHPDIQDAVFKEDKYELQQYQEGQFQMKLTNGDPNLKPFPLPKPQKNAVAKITKPYTTPYTRQRPASVQKPSQIKR